MDTSHTELFAALCPDGSYVVLRKSGSFASEANEPHNGGTLQTASLRTAFEWTRLLRGQAVYHLIPVVVTRIVTIKTPEQPCKP